MSSPRHASALLGFAKSIRLCLQLWEKPSELQEQEQGTAPRDGLVHRASSLAQPLWSCETALLPSCLSSSKDIHSPAQLFFFGLDGFAQPQPPSHVGAQGGSEEPCTPGALAPVSSAQHSQGDPMAGSGWCCPWARALPAAPAPGAAGFWGCPKAAGHSGGGETGWAGAWLGWGLGCCTGAGIPHPSSSFCESLEEPRACFPFP